MELKRRPESVSIHPDLETIEKIKEFYLPYKEDNPGDYIVFFARYEKTTITIYSSKKEDKNTVVFAGENALKEAQLFDKNAKLSIPKSKRVVNKPIINEFPQIGSDEVGTGDLFGPVVVAAAHVGKRHLPLLEELGVTDSKLMDDDTILKIVPKLLKRIDYSLLVLMPEKFNQVNLTNNMNKIKAKMHNRALYNLSLRHPFSTIYIDQFAEPSTYYSYLENESFVVKNITFSTKGELHFPSVAVASLIARYAFLRKMKVLSKELKQDIPLGAGKKADDFLREILKNKNKEELKKFAKLSFANFKKIED